MAHLFDCFILLIILNAFNFVRNNEQVINVQTTSGNIKGKVVQANNKTFHVFLGIPYAKPPLENLRFQPPQPLDSSSEGRVVDATKGFSKQCIQAFHIEENESEDCLYLNVMTPMHNNLGQRKYPVMVWIHGGTFVVGSANQFPIMGTLKNIVSRDVIFVSINYRLGAFGFFTTKSSVASGNYGMLDQVESLRWVQKNIQAFGGDPSKVTIAGVSAGGASVSLLTISPLTKGLFSQAILMSGSAFGPYASMIDENPLDLSTDLLKNLNCTTNTSVELKETCKKDDCSCKISAKPQCPFAKRSENPKIELNLEADKQKLLCLQSKSTNDIMKNDKHLFGWSIRVDNLFLKDKLEESMKARPPYNLMIGITRDEGALVRMLDIPGSQLVLSEERFYQDLGFNSLYSLCQYHKHPGLVNFTSRYHYAHRDLGQRVAGFTEKAVWFQKYTQLESAVYFWIPAYRDAMEALKTRSKVYMYSWDWVDAMELYKNVSDFYYKGAVHGSEIFYLFDMSAEDFKAIVSFEPVAETLSKKDKTHDARATSVMGALLTNFVKFGPAGKNGIKYHENQLVELYKLAHCISDLKLCVTLGDFPSNPDTEAAGATWKPFNEREQNYLSINFPKSEMKNDFYREDVEFWLKFLPDLENSFQCQ